VISTRFGDECRQRYATGSILCVIGMVPLHQSGALGLWRPCLGPALRRFRPRRRCDCAHCVVLPTRRVRDHEHRRAMSPATTASSATPLGGHPAGYGASHAEPLATTALPTLDPTASILAERVLRAVVETIGGRRPAQQLSTMLRPDLLTSLASLQAMAAPLQPRVRKVVTRHQGPGVMEAVAVVTLSTGVRALAARFEKHLDDHGARWRCTALQLRLTAGDLASHRRHRQR
jgi:hypothetical protein